MATTQEFNIIANLLFTSNLQQIRASQQAIKDLAKTTGASASEVKQAFSASNAQIDMQNRLNVANDLMEQSGLNAEELSRALKAQGMILTKTGQLTDLYGNKMKMAEINMNKLRRSAWRFNMNMLTIMFGLMAINRVLSSFTKSAISTYQKANEETQGLGKATWHLQAAWEFFKYSLVDALTQSPLFKLLVQWLIQLVQWFNKLSPVQKSILAWGIALLTVATAAGVLYSAVQPLFSLAWASLGSGLFGAGGLIGGLTMAGDKLTALQKIARIGLGITLIWKGIDMIKEGVLEGKIWKEFVGVLGTTLGGALIGSAFGPVGAGIGAVIGLTLGIVIDAFFSWKKQKVVNDVNKNLKEMGMLIENQPTYGTKIGIDPVIASGSLADLENLRASTLSAQEMGTAFLGAAETTNWLAVETGNLGQNFNELIPLQGDFTTKLNATTGDMWKFSDAVSAVNIGNSPTGLVHIINSEGQIIALQPTFSQAINMMTNFMKALSVEITSQTAQYTALIKELDKYIIKLQQAAAAEKKNKSSGIMGTIKSVLGFKATGGMISQTGPYMLHEGEMVVPRGSPGNAYASSPVTNNSYNIDLVINAETNNPEELSRIILEQINDQINRRNDSANG